MKRLQRARKFLHLVEALGEDVLNAFPEVCVSRLDGIRIQGILSLTHETPSGEIVKRIRSHLTALKDST
jgi:hypothetical protein